MEQRKKRKHYIKAGRFKLQRLGIHRHEFDPFSQVFSTSVFSRRGQHFLGKVDTNAFGAVADRLRRFQRDHTCSRSYVEHTLTSGDVSHGDHSPSERGCQGRTEALEISDMSVVARGIGYFKIERAFFSRIHFESKDEERLSRPRRMFPSDMHRG